MGKSKEEMEGIFGHFRIITCRLVVKCSQAGLLGIVLEEFGVEIGDCLSREILYPEIGISGTLLFSCRGRRNLAGEVGEGIEPGL